MGRSVTSWTTLIHLSEDGEGLEAGLGFGIDRFFDQFLPAIQLSAAMFHLGFYRRLEPLSEVLNESGLFWSPVSIELNKDGLEMLEVRCPILNFLLLVLGVSLNSTPDGIHESPGVSEILSKESFELDPRQGGFGCLVLSTLVLVPTKADLTMKEQSCKRGMVGAGGAGGSEMILALLTEVVAFHMRLSIIEIGQRSGNLAFSCPSRWLAGSGQPDSDGEGDREVDGEGNGLKEGHEEAQERPRAFPGREWGTWKIRLWRAGRGRGGRRKRRW